MRTALLAIFYFIVVSVFSLTEATEPTRWEQGVGGEITSLGELRWLSENSSVWGEDYTWTLAANINASETQNWNWSAIHSTYLGFSPIGTTSKPFKGTFDGQSFTISDLYINVPQEHYAGLFAYAVNASIKDINLKNLDLSGVWYVGGLLAFGDSVSVFGVEISGQVIGQWYVGGLVGHVMRHSGISHSLSNADVVANSQVGGVVGCITASSIAISSSSGAVIGERQVGGLVGYSREGIVENSLATGAAMGDDRIGGLVGDVSDGSLIKNSYSTGVVWGTTRIGGLLGYAHQSSIENCYYDAHTSYMGNVAIGEGEGDVEALQTNDFYQIENLDLPLGSDALSPWKANALGRPYLYWTTLKASNSAILSAYSPDYNIEGSVQNEGSAIVEKGVRYRMPEDDWTYKSSYSSGSENSILFSSSDLIAGESYLFQSYFTTADEYVYGDMTRASLGFVIFDANGARGEMPDAALIIDKPAQLPPVSFTMRGYDFLSWNYLDDASGDSLGDQEELILEYEDTTLFAIWDDIDYSINYELDGGTNHSNNLDSYTVDSATFILGNPYKRGYTFEAWYNSLLFNQTVVEIPHNSIGDTILYAKWLLRDYPINYVLNGGDTSNANNPISYTTEDSTIVFNDPLKLGYDFLGWYQDPTMTYARIDSIATGGTTEKTLYAKFSLISYEIAYQDNGADFDGNNPAEYTIEDTIDFIDGSKAGYLFDGWYGDSLLLTPVSDFLPGTWGDTVLYANWDAIIYHINYHLNGGVNSEMNPLSFIVEDSTIVLHEASKVGYDFVGWHQDPTLTYGQLDSIVGGSTRDYTVYAKFLPNNYELRYVVDDETTIDSELLRYTIEDTISLDSPTKLGYTFEGWFTDSSFLTLINELPTGTIGDTSLYALFSRDDFTITYHFNYDTDSINNPDSFNIETSTITLQDAYSYGLTFGGWYTDSTYSTQVTEIPQGTLIDTTIHGYFYKYSGGSGTEEDPYQIANFQDLRALSEYANPEEGVDAYIGDWQGTYFEQVTDIDASQTANPSWNMGQGFSPIGNQLNKFCSDYTTRNYNYIKGLYINSPNYPIGLFGVVDSCIISNLRIIDCDITGYFYVGGFVGIARNNSSIKNCSTGGIIAYTNPGTNGFAGGFCGFTAGSIECCVSSCDIVMANGKRNGGFAGSIGQTGNVTNCYSTGTVTGKRYLGGFVGEMDGAIQAPGATIADCYTISEIVSSASSFNSFVGTTDIDAGAITTYRNNYFDNQQTKSLTGTGANSLTTQQFKDATLENLGFSDTIWGKENSLYPYLLWENNLQNITFIVKDAEDNLLDSAIVSIQGVDIATDSNGVAILKTISGDYTYSVTKYGYEEINDSLTLSLNDTSITITLGYSKYSGGSGTEDDPYLIATLEDLRKLSEDANPEIGVAPYIGDWLGGKFYEQVSYIDASHTIEWNDSAGFIPIGFGSQFIGSYNGNGYAIEALNINRPSEKIALFSVIYRSKIVNLRLPNIRVNGKMWVGAVSGHVGNMSVIEGCSSSGIISGETAYVGGITGWLSFGSIINCYSQCKVECLINQSTGGGLVGFVWSDGSVENSFSVGSSSINMGGIPEEYYTGLCLWNKTQGGQITNSYWDVTTSGIYSDGYVGEVEPLTTQGFKESSLEDLGFPDSIWGKENSIYPYFLADSNDYRDIAFIVKDSADNLLDSAILTIQGVDIATDANGIAILKTTSGDYTYSATKYGYEEITDSLTLNSNDTSITITLGYSKYSGGSGTEDDPYLIASLEDLRKLSEDANPEIGVDPYIGDWQGKYFEQVADIDADSTRFWNIEGGDTLGFVPIANPLLSGGATYTGFYNGNGYEIRDLYINQVGLSYVGLFSYVIDNGIISNITLTNCDISGGYSTGALIGLVRNSEVLNCHSDGYVTSTNSSEANSNTGGLIGNCFAIVKESSSSCTVTSDKTRVGGFVGHLANAFDGEDCQIINCYAVGNVTGTTDVGGFCGGTGSNGVSNIAYLTNCYSTGGTSHLTGGFDGGFVEYGMSAIITACYYDSALTKQSDTLGGSAPLSTQQFKDATLANLGFPDSIWGKENSIYPYFLADSNDYYDITFIVKDSSDNLLDSALVTIQGVDIATDANGVAILKTTSGDYTYSATKYGYEEIADSLTLNSNDTLVTIQLNTQIFSINYEMDSGLNLNPLSYHTDSGIVLFHPQLNDSVFGMWYSDSNYTTVVESIPLGETRDTILYAFFKYSGGLGTEEYPYLIASHEDLRKLSENANPETSAAPYSGDWQGQYFKQVADIDASVIDNFSPIGKTNDEFSGVYDGGGYVIQNLNINSNNPWRGLFGRNMGHLKDVILLDATILSSQGGLGGLVGLNIGVIENCEVKNVRVTSETAPAGGLVGSNYGVINKCISSGRVVAYFSAGGLVGIHYDGSISNSYSTTSVSADNYLGGGVGQVRSDAIISNSYAVGLVANINGYVGGFIGYKHDSFVGSINKSYWDSETSRQTTSPEGAGKTTQQFKDATLADLGFPDSIWGKENSIYPYFLADSNDYYDITFTITDEDDNPIDSAIVTIQGVDIYADENGVVILKTDTGLYSYTIEKDSFLIYQDSVQLDESDQSLNIELTYGDGKYSGGFGTVEFPYLIGTTEDLLDLTYNARPGGIAPYVGDWITNYSFKQIRDIDAASISNMNPIGNTSGNFVGTYDGGGYTIKNINIDRTSSHFVGLFGLILKGTIKRLAVSGEVKGYSKVGGLVGYISESVDIENCYANCLVSAEFDDVGGLVGKCNLYSSPNITNCYSIGIVTGTRKGGLIGTIEAGGVYLNNYFDENMSGCTDSKGARAMSTADMKTASTFSTWDTTIWDIQDGQYPTLK